MISVEEVAAWSNEEIVQNIEALKPDGSSFSHGFDKEEMFWYVQFETESEILWEGAFPDQRLALFNAFGWAFAERQPNPPVGSVWHRRSDHVLVPVSSNKREIDGPEDLDASEVQSVYRAK